MLSNLVRPDIFQTFDEWISMGWLRPLDGALAKLLHDDGHETNELVLLLAAFTSEQVGHGHSCLDIRHLFAQTPDAGLEGPPGQVRTTPAELFSKYDADTALIALGKSAVVDQGTGHKPLVLDRERLYLRRYWQYQQIVADKLQMLLSQSCEPPQKLAKELSRFFSANSQEDDGLADWQKIACAVATRARLTVITGGPGTGKTSTVVKLLGLLQKDACQKKRPLRIRLAAPTGKAAARLTESIGFSVRELPVSERVRARIPTEVTTLHRLLGARRNSRHFHHDYSNPLHADLIIIDEASMIDLEMMANLLGALGPATSLVLIGDKDQLASVEAGAIMGDLCKGADKGLYHQSTIDWIATQCGEDVGDFAGDGSQLAQQMVMLRRNYRFGHDSGIGKLARAVNAGDSAQVAAIWQEGHKNIHRPSVRRMNDPTVEALCVEGYAPYLEMLNGGTSDDVETHAAEVLKVFSNFQLLCALREGPAGVAGLNRRIAHALHERGLIQATEGWYVGRPVIVTRNNYSLGLMNGDVGIVLNTPDTESGTRLRVAFQLPNGRIRLVSPGRLDSVETVYAMTVHKSQGSEFLHVALLLPDTDSSVLTRELFYTAITRARGHFTLLATRQAVVDCTVERRTFRASGLSDLL